MDNFFHNNKKWFKTIDGFIVSDEDIFFNTLYKAITNHPQYVITSDLEDDQKEDILSTMLKYFENKEEFEKCASLFNIKKQINIAC